LITNWEGLPLSILEAMRAGLPVVASDVGGIAETIREGETGHLVGRGSVDQVRERIGRLLAEPGLRARLGAAGRSLYERQFTLEHCVTRTLEVYQSVLAGKARTAAVASRSGDVDHGTAANTRISSTTPTEDAPLQ
jgi:glycosyltransferase involved in cell wall biosynthesis